jgi:hypothetical protein
MEKNRIRDGKHLDPGSDPQHCKKTGISHQIFIKKLQILNLLLEVSPSSSWLLVEVEAVRARSPPPPLPLPLPPPPRGISHQIFKKSYKYSTCCWRSPPHRPPRPPDCWWRWRLWGRGHHHPLSPSHSLLPGPAGSARVATVHLVPTDKTYEVHPRSNWKK